MPDILVASFSVWVTKHRQLAIRILENLGVGVVLALAESRRGGKQWAAILGSQRLGQRRALRYEAELALQLIDALAFFFAVFVRQLVDNVVHLLGHTIIVSTLLVGGGTYFVIGRKHRQIQRRPPDYQRAHTGTT